MDLGQFTIGNALGAFNNYGNALQGIGSSSALANALSSANMQARYAPAASVDIGRMNSDAAIRQAQLQADVQRQIAQMQADIAKQQSMQGLLGSLFGAQGGITQQRLSGDSALKLGELQANMAREVAGLQNTGALDLERERSARLNTTLPAIMSLFGGGMGGGGASIGTNYGASASLNRPTTQPSNDQSFRPQWGPMNRNQMAGQMPSAFQLSR